MSNLYRRQRRFKHERQRTEPQDERQMPEGEDRDEWPEPTEPNEDTPREWWEAA